MVLAKKNLLVHVSIIILVKMIIFIDFSFLKILKNVKVFGQTLMTYRNTRLLSNQLDTYIKKINGNGRKNEQDFHFYKD